MLDIFASNELALILFNVGLGLIAALFAYSRGRNFWGWWLFGIFAFVPAIALVVILEPNQAELDKRDWEAGTLRLCPYCGEFIQKDIQFCRHCRHEVSGKQAIYIGEIKTILDPKNCPYCAAPIKAGATYCRFCDHTLSVSPDHALTEDEVAVQTLVTEFVNQYGYVYQPGLVANSVILTHIEREITKRQPKTGEAITADPELAKLQDLARRFRQALVKIGQLPPAAIPVTPDSRVFVAGRDA